MDMLPCTSYLAVQDMYKVLKNQLGFGVPLAVPCGQSWSSFSSSSSIAKLGFENVTDDVGIDEALGATIAAPFSGSLGIAFFIFGFKSSG